jgi:hypothetical protein
VGEDRGHVTSGALIDSIGLRCFAWREDAMISFMRLYRSMRKLSVGPFDRRTIRIDGAISVNVKARRCVTCNAGAIVKKSLSLFRERSFAWTKTSISASVATKKGQEEERADPKSGCSVGFHDLANVPGQLRERGADLAMFYNKRFGNVIKGRR